MKMLMVFALLLGVMAMLTSSLDDTAPYGGAERTVAMNYALYRNEVFRYALAEKAPDGSIADSILKLPPGWVALRPWKARILNGRCYVYGTATAPEIEAVRDLFQGSIAVGRVANGQIMPQPGKRVPVASFVPEGDLVSIIEVR